QVDLGRRGTFAIRGFAEASLVYFGKDMGQLTVAEAATLAGHIQRPSYTNPFKWPERAQKRRNIILMLMRENGFLDDREYAVASASPLELNKGGVGSTDAPYFVDLVNDELQEKFGDHDFQTRAYKVYTTLDMNLQREAVEAVRLGMKEVDQRLKNRKRADGTPAEAQVALVAIDSHSGEVKALIGGRNYGLSQLNRVMAKRQPGSSFKPFVYAAALNTALNDSGNPITVSTQILDEPTTFWFDGKPYEPH
ncbi:MAG: transglycosylase domain-containing protein, partial [Bryobacterales bacterium]|nr:transglycosylase domain-containing protein [Bryobacterales bacterium]